MEGDDSVRKEENFCKKTFGGWAYNEKLDERSKWDDDDDKNAVGHGGCKNTNIYTTLRAIIRQFTYRDTFPNVPVEVLILTPHN